MISIPFGGIEIAAGSGTQALSSTAALFNLWNASTGSNKTNTGDAGDPAVQPDKANNRVKVNSPGTYLVQFDIVGETDTAKIITARLRKNGSAVAGAMAQLSWAGSNAKNTMSFVAIVPVSQSDSPGTISTMPAASTTGFSGASGALQTSVALDVTLESDSGTPTVTINNAHLNVMRLS